MSLHLSLILLVAALGADPLSAGNQLRKLSVDGVERSYLVHAPPKLDTTQPTPVVLILHGAATDATITMFLTGMNQKSDAAGFVAVYPNGTGRAPFLTWNAGGRFGRFARTGDDVKFIAAVLDDLEQAMTVDSRRVYATGLSNGGMMCYRLAAEMSERIAAIAPVAGTMAIDDPQPQRPVPVLHFHGTADTFVGYNGPGPGTPSLVTYKSVADTMAAWVKLNDCPDTPEVRDEPDTQDDGTRVVRKTWGPGNDGSEVILLEIQNGGHTWPGRHPRLPVLGKSTLDISANDLMWEFFQKHPRPDKSDE